jgi:uncharacterized protein YybS (DUF2232 family)
VNQSLRTRAIVEGALMATLTAILALVSIYIPVLRIVTDLIWTIPVIIVTVRHGLRTGILTTGVAGLLIFTLAGPRLALLMLLQFGILAMLYGHAFHKNWNPGITLLGGTLVSILAMILVVFLSFSLFGLGTFSIHDYIQESMEATMQLYRGMGLIGPETGHTEESLRQILQESVQMFITFIPALFVLYGLFTAFINYIIAQMVLRRLEIQVPHLPPFSKWRLPWWVIWGFIVGYGMNLAGGYLANPVLSKIGTNIIFIYTPVLFLLGLAVVFHMLQKYTQTPGFFRPLVLLFVLLFARYAIWLLAGIGLIDLVFNYRQLPGND